MKRAIAGLAMVFLAQLAQAEVAGIYVAADDPGRIYTVSRNGNSILLLQHRAEPAYASTNFEDGQAAYPVSMYTMTYQLGQLAADGQSATVAGSGAAGVCSATYKLQFSDAGLRLSLLGMQNPLGAAVAIDCPALATRQKADQQAAGGGTALIKIF